MVLGIRGAEAMKYTLPLFLWRRRMGFESKMLCSGTTNA